MSNFEKFSDKMFEKVSRQKSSFFMRVALVGIVVLMILVYFIMPFSKVASYEFEGTYFYSDEEVLEIMNLKKSTYLFNVKKNKVESLLNNHPLIENANVEITPISYKVKMKEIAPLYKKENDVYLNNNNLFDNNLLNNTLVGEKLKYEIEKVPFMINELSEFNTLVAEYNSLLPCMEELILSLCGFQRENIEYIKFIKNEDDPNGFFYLYLPISDIAKNKYFENNDGKFVFILDAASIQYYRNKYGDYLFNLSYQISKYLHELLNGNILKNNVDEATLVQEEIFDKIVLTRKFRISIKNETKKLEFVALKK